MFLGKGIWGSTCASHPCTPPKPPARPLAHMPHVSAQCGRILLSETMKEILLKRAPRGSASEASGSTESS